jgi:hypothetical protein
LGGGGLPHACGEAVVVTKADFLRGNRIVLVDHRHGPGSQQAPERGRHVEVPAAILKVFERQQNLRGSDAMGGQQFGPEARQRNLPDRGGGLRIGKAPRPPLASPRRRAPSAIAPEDTTITSCPRARAAAISATSAASHSRLGCPSLPTSKAEPTLITRRGQWADRRCGKAD